MPAFASRDRRAKGHEYSVTAIGIPGRYWPPRRRHQGWDWSRDAAAHLFRHGFDSLDERPHRLRQFGVLLQKRPHAFRQRRVLAEHVDQQRGLPLRFALPLLVEKLQFLAVLRVGDRIHLVAVGLPRLREQDERGCVGRLCRKGEIEQDERINVEIRPADRVHEDPDRDEDGLRDEEGRRAEKAREGFRLESEPVVSEDRIQMGVRQMKSSRALVHACAPLGPRRADRTYPCRLRADDKGSRKPLRAACGARGRRLWSPSSTDFV